MTQFGITETLQRYGVIQNRTMHFSKYIGEEVMKLLNWMGADQPQREFVTQYVVCFKLCRHLLLHMLTRLSWRSSTVKSYHRPGCFSFRHRRFALRMLCLAASTIPYKYIWVFRWNVMTLSIAGALLIMSTRTAVEKKIYSERYLDVIGRFVSWWIKETA